MKRLLFVVALLTIFSFNVHAQQHSIYTLHPSAKVAFVRAGLLPFTLSRTTELVIGEKPTATELHAIEYLQSLIRAAIGDSLTEVPASVYQSGVPAIVIGDTLSSSAIRTLLPHSIPSNESAPAIGGYTLDIEPNLIVLAGVDSNGTFNGVSTLAQLWNVNGKTATIAAANLWDQPDYEIRGVFSGHNLLVNSQDSIVKSIEDVMALHKMNALMQSDYKYGVLDLMESLGLTWYFTNAKSLQQYSYGHNIDLIPSLIDMGWSSATLEHDANLAEGFPATAEYVIRNNTGEIVSDPNVTIPNGGFENFTGNHFNAWSFYDGDGSFTTVDRTNFHSGSASAKCSDVPSGTNCRFERTVNCLPRHAYILSCWIRTNNFSGGAPQLLALAFGPNNTSRALTATSFYVGATSNGWTKLQVAFNTLDFNQVGLYVGVWGGFSGTMWLDDFEVQDMGLTNVLRRAGTPLWVKNHTTGHVYREGIDFAPIIDSVMLANKGAYPIDHAPATITVLPSSAIHNGDTLDVSFSTAITTDNSPNGDGKVMACVSEDTLYEIMTDQVSRVDTLYHPKRFFMEHDEIRELGWDSACLNRNLSAAALLADNATHAFDIIQQVHPGADVFVWSDMFDSLHNAHNNYYLVNGDLTGDWLSIPKALTIVNWNGGYKSESLAKFGALGFSQISSPYYDVQSTENMRAWRLAQIGIPNMRGMMYTTWVSDYSFLTQFGDYAWGIAPYIYHTPLDSNTLIALHGVDGPVRISAEILPDAYDPSDTIAYATLFFGDRLDSAATVSMVRDTGNSWAVTITPTGGLLSYLWYRIETKDKNGIDRSTPVYQLAAGSLGVSRATEQPIKLTRIFPNPTSGLTSLEMNFSQPHSWAVDVYDVLGRDVKRLEGFAGSGIQKIDLDLGPLSAGVYSLQFRSGTTIVTTAVTLIH